MDEEWTRVTCHWGWCTHHVVNGKIDCGFGPMTCPCDHLPGWKSPYTEGQARPAAPVKARGRHGGRVQRSRKRHALRPGYMDVFGGMLPARCNYVEA